MIRPHQWPFRCTLPVCFSVLFAFFSTFSFFTFAESGFSFSSGIKLFSVCAFASLPEMIFFSSPLSDFKSTYISPLFLPSNRVYLFVPLMTFRNPSPSVYKALRWGALPRPNTRSANESPSVLAGRGMPANWQMVGSKSVPLHTSELSRSPCAIPRPQKMNGTR